MQQSKYLKSNVKGNPDTKVYIWFHLFEILEKAKHQWPKADQQLPVDRVGTGD